MDYSLYLHVPFCQVRCSYCDFNTYAGLEGLIPSYTDALAGELRGVARGGAASAGLPVHTIFFGGGTPSLLPLARIAELLDAIRSAYDVHADAEVTLEANPGTVDRPFLGGLRRLGVNRLSFGVQSAHRDELRLLDRLHTFEAVVRGVADARAAGFSNLNLDLMFGLPRQALDAWKTSLEAVLELAPEHLSLYALTLEHGTPMQHWVERGDLPAPDPDLAAEMYLLAARRLGDAGFVQYEISNWARTEGKAVAAGELPHYACRHNLQYWRNEPYLGFGAGAHGCAAGWRYANVRSPRAYIERIRCGAWPPFPFSPAAVEKEGIRREREMEETMMLALRLTGEGVGVERFRSRFGLSPVEVYRLPLQELERNRLVRLARDRVRLTPRGRLLANQVFERFVEVA